MAYTDIGFDENLQRIEPTSSQSGSQSLDASEADTFFDQLSGSKINGGTLQSPDGRIKLNLDSGFFQVNNGVQNLVQFGILPDGTVGLLIQDSQGNILMKVSEGEFYLQSPKKTSKLDLIADQYTVRDEQQRLKVLLGFDPKGF